jgi:hypothetical protein
MFIFVAALYLGGFINCLLRSTKIFYFDFCNDNVIDDFFCDLLPLVKLAYGRKEDYQDPMYFLLISNVITPIVLILGSFIPLHLHHYLEDTLHPGPPQGLLYMLLPPDLGNLMQ